MRVMSAAAGLTRREFLLSIAAMGIAGVGLAACGGSSSGPTAPAAPSGAPAPASALASASSAPSIGTLRLASTSLAGTQTPLWLAENLGSWPKRGLTVERSQVTADVGTKTLLAKEIDVLMQSPPAIITADLNGGLDLVYVASIFNHSQFALVVQPSIQSAADLKGKSVGTDLPGTTSDFQTRVLLSKLGLQPSDVNLVKLEPTQGIAAALVSGQIQAGTLGMPQPYQLEAKGFRLLANTFDIQYQNIGPVVLRSRIDELSSRLVPLLLGMRDGMQAFTAQPDLAKRLIGQFTKESDPAIIQRTYDFYNKDVHFQEDLQPTLEGIKSIIDFLASTTLPKAQNAKPEQFVDLRILDRLPRP
jgi:ABC-type nitrate/sulfonate/bicarbonate transport system substrate-binding protein